MRDMPGSVKKVCSLAMSLFVLIGCMGSVQADTESQTETQTQTQTQSETEDNKLINRYPVYQNTDYEDLTIPYYLNYIKEGDEKGWKDATGSAISVDLATGVTDEGTPIVLDNGTYHWENEGAESVEWTFEVTEPGYYNMQIGYTPVGEGIDSPRRGINIDGERTYRELLPIVFDRLWKDEGEPWVNSLGDEVRPKQVQENVPMTTLLYDSLGRSAEPLKIYLTAGTHKFKMTFVQEGIDINSISFTIPEVIPTYAEVSADYQAKGYQNATQPIKIDAERPLEKTASSLRLDTSTDPLADPPSISHTVLNAIGGSYWSGGGQGITWQFDVQQAGLYRIDLRVLSKYNDGLSSFRQIRVDGKVPFQEFLCYEFAYGDWTTTGLTDENGDPYLVYLEEGTHTLELVVVTSAYAEILVELEGTLNILSDVIQNIIRITGIDPDVNFDYRLDARIPGLMDNMQAISDSLLKQIELLTNMSEKTPGTVNNLKEIQYRVARMIEDPDSIAAGLNKMIEDQTTLSNWINGFNNLPLMLDYIVINSPDVAVEEKHANVFQKLWAGVQTFLLSFTRDYDAVAGARVNDDGTVVEETSEPLEIWVARGKEWAEILKQISDEEFTEETGVYCNFNMLPAGQLGTSGIMLLAVASGTEPDVVLGSDTSVPAEYGMRGVIADLKQFDNYEEVEQRFLAGSMVPYEFEGAVYGLPETVDFSIMYYRTDIMASLNLKIPETWDELYSLVLPELKRNGMDFWYEGGMNSFLYQAGGSFYTEDGKKSALDTQEAYEAFKRFADLYVVYDVPVSANFYNRFRAGQMPIGISSFNTYMLLSSAAPELEGKWEATVIPGTVREDGTIDRSNNITSTSALIFNTTDMLEEAWQFLEWYTRAETQTRYASDLVSYIGPEARWCSATIEAFDTLSWNNNLKQAIQAQRVYCQGVPNVVGGYILARHLENARVRSVIEGMNYRESIEQAAEDINRELDLKNEEFAMRAEKEAEKAAENSEK